MQHPGDVELANEFAEDVTQLLGLVQAPAGAADLAVHDAHRRPKPGDRRQRRDGTKDRIPDRDREAEIAGLEENRAAGQKQAGAHPAPQIEAEDRLGGDQRVEQVGDSRCRRRKEQDPRANHQVIENQQENGRRPTKAGGRLLLDREPGNPVIGSEKPGHRKRGRQRRRRLQPDQQAEGNDQRSKSELDE